MTTIIGIKGTDLENGEHYALILADSRGSLSGNRMGDDERKLFGDSNGNYALGTAGKCIANFFSKKNSFEKELSDFLLNPKKETKQSIENTLGMIDAELEEIVGSKNQYFVALQEDMPKIYVFNGAELVESGAYAAIGSGMMYTKCLNELGKYKLNLEGHRLDKRIILPIDNAMAIAIEAMNEAGASDSATGGRISATIVTKSGVKVIPHCGLIESKSGNIVLGESEDISQKGIHPYHFED
jgi:hypothetical protein